jgi:hypothetical protein
MVQENCVILSPLVVLYYLTPITPSHLGKGDGGCGDLKTIQ